MFCFKAQQDDDDINDDYSVYDEEIIEDFDQIDSVDNEWAENSDPQELPMPGHDGKFLDEAFPPSLESLGTPKQGRSFIDAQAKLATQWIRVPDLIMMHEELSLDDVELFGEIDTCNLAQGQVGNCWLVASMAALAEFPAEVKRLFVEADVQRGRYVVRLFDMSKAEWENIEIDDYIPCIYKEDWLGIPYSYDLYGRIKYDFEDVYHADFTSKLPWRWVPHFVGPNGKECWAPLLEKAMAKFVGSYAWLAGGNESYALMAFTGFPLVYCFVRPGPDDRAAELGEWEWNGAQYNSRDKTGPGFAIVPGTQPLSDQEMCEKIFKYGDKNYLTCCSISKYRRPETTRGFFRSDGLVLGHAYSLLACNSVNLMDGSTMLLLQLRNPHGEGQVDANGMFTTKWNGEWSDNCILWEQHPEVAQQINFEPANDGIFWMSWDDFSYIFDKITVLPKSMATPPSETLQTLREDVSSGWQFFAQILDTLMLSPSKEKKSINWSRTDAAYKGSREIRNDCDTDVYLSLAKYEGGNTLRHLRSVSFVFDPYVNMPDWVDDGKTETKLVWAAAKPGRLQNFLDSQTGGSGYNWCRDKITELGLERALGPDGHI